MSPLLDCPYCGQELDVIRNVTLFRDPDDGSAVDGTACPSCGRLGHRARLGPDESSPVHRDGITASSNVML